MAVSTTEQSLGVAPAALSPAISGDDAAHHRRHGHAVHFYGENRFLAARVGKFLAEGAAAGDALLVVAEPAHASAIRAALAAHGFAVDDLEATGTVTFLDAAQTLSSFMVGVMPDAELFDRTIGPTLDRIGKTARSAHVRIFGEMVELLWRAGNRGAAIRLEELWNSLLEKKRSFSLLCAYSVAGFFKEPSHVEDVTRTHTHVLTPDVDDTDGHAVGVLAAEIAQRREVEEELRRSLIDLRQREQQLRRLTRITGAMADAVTTEQVFDAVVDQVATTVGASSAGLWLVDENRRAHLVRALGYHDDARSLLDNAALDGTFRFPVLDTISRSEAIWIETQADLLATYPLLAAHITPGRAYRISCLPIRTQGRTLGALAFTFDDAPALDADARNFLMLVARYGAQALERLRLLNAERELREGAEHAAARLSLLNRASRGFSALGSDVDRLLQDVAQEVVREYAHACGIVLLAADGTRDVAVALHRDPTASTELDALLRSGPPSLGGALLRQVLSTGQPILAPDLPEQLVLDVPHPPLEDWLARHRPRSLVLVPLHANGVIVGALGAFRQHPSPPFTDADLHMLGELGDRTAIALQTSRLYRDNEAARLRAEMLYGLAGAVMRAESLDEVFGAALDAIERTLRTDRSAILVIDADGVMRFKAWRGLSDDYRSAVEGHSPWPRDVRQPEPVVVADAVKDPSLAAFVPLFTSERIGALGFIPLVAGERLIGKFMVYYAEPRDLGSQELEMARAIANHVAAAIVRFSAITELQRTVRFNEIFTGILGHDLRNPLSAIMTAAQVVIRRGEVEKVAKPISRILTSGERMARMIDQLLDFTRVRVGNGIPIFARTVDLLPVVTQIIEELDDANPQWTLRLETDGGDTTGMWDSDRLAQVFSNLVANAVQHGIAEHGVMVRVIGNEPDHVRVVVHNAGSIDPAILSKLFEPMAGADRRRDRSQGLGLGLYISREILKAHGGAIRVESSAEHGTTFTVSLPRAAWAARGA